MRLCKIYCIYLDVYLFVRLVRWTMKARELFKRQLKMLREVEQCL